MIRSSVISWPLFHSKFLLCISILVIFLTKQFCPLSIRCTFCFTSHRCCVRAPSTYDRLWQAVTHVMTITLTAPNGRSDENWYRISFLEVLFIYLVDDFFSHFSLSPTLSFRWCFCCVSTVKFQNVMENHNRIELDIGWGSWNVENAKKMSQRAIILFWSHFFVILSHRTNTRTHRTVALTLSNY